MVDAVIRWLDQETEMQGAFDDRSDFNVGQLEDELKAENESVTAAHFIEDPFGLWAGNTIYVICPQAWSGPDQAALEAVIAAHIPEGLPVDPANRESWVFSGTTDSSGEFSGTFDRELAEIPNVIPSIVGGAGNDTIRVTSRTTEGFTVKVSRIAIAALVVVHNPVPGVSVDVLVTSNDNGA